MIMVCQRSVTDILHQKTAILHVHSRKCLVVFVKIIYHWNSISSSGFNFRHYTKNIYTSIHVYKLLIWIKDSTFIWTTPITNNTYIHVQYSIYIECHIQTSIPQHYMYSITELQSQKLLNLQNKGSVSIAQCSIFNHS